MRTEKRNNKTKSKPPIISEQAYGVFNSELIKNKQNSKSEKELKSQTFESDFELMKRDDNVGNMTMM